MLSNVKQGIAIGLFFTAAYSLYSIGLYLLAGSEPFASLGTTLSTVLVAYLFGGVVGGAIVGLLQPFVRNRMSAVLIGIAAAFFVSIGLLVTTRGMISRWGGAEWFTVVVMSVIFGTFGANFFWKSK